MTNPRPLHPGCSRFPSRSPRPAADRRPSLPVAGVDAIDDAHTALGLLDEFRSHPPAFQTLAILLDHERRGTTIVNYDGTTENDSVLWVADHLTEVAHRVDDVGGVIIASVRPGGSDELDDVDRWLTIDEQLEIVGIELVEWFVIARSVSCPRSLLGDASRWAA